MKRRGSRLTGVALALIAAACLFALARAEAAFGPLGQDQRISFMGPDGDHAFGASDPTVAYNPAADEYLVVWSGTDDAEPLADNEIEIYAQRLSGSRAPLGRRIRVSEQGQDGIAAILAFHPAVAYNAAANEYLVVWTGDMDPSSGDELEVFGRRLSAAGERLGGPADLRISAMGPDGDDAYDARNSSVAANPATGEYLVVWEGDDNTTPLVDNELEIFGQLLTAAGMEVPPDDFRISEQGADSNPDSDAFSPSVAHNPARNEYLVAWAGEIGTSNDFEIWAQRLSAAGKEEGGNDFQVSNMDPHDAVQPSIAADATGGEYLVVWRGRGYAPPTAGEPEIFGQRLTGEGVQRGIDDFPISEQGSGTSDAYEPSVAYDPTVGEYLVVWEGEIGTSDEIEIFGQRLSTTGAEVGGSDFQLSHVGPEGDPDYAAGDPHVAANPSAGEYLVIWSGVGNAPALDEVFGLWLGVPPPTLAATDPLGPANDNNPRVKGSVAADSTVDLFTNGTCAGAPAVNDAPAAALTGAGIALPVADNTTTQLSATASSDGRTSRCSNSIAYTELTPALPPLLRDTLAPVVSGFAVSPGRFRVAGAAAPPGSRFRFRLSERASARIVVERALPGRRVGRRCLKPTRKLRVRARCTRFKRAGTLVLRDRSAGQNSVPFRGRIGRRALATGSYRATITAMDRAGNRSAPRRTSFRIVRQ